MKTSVTSQRGALHLTRVETKLPNRSPTLDTCCSKQGGSENHFSRFDINWLGNKPTTRVGKLVNEQVEEAL